MFTRMHTHTHTRTRTQLIFENLRVQIVGLTRVVGKYRANVMAFAKELY
jgi:hypothetical protein